MGNLEIGKLEFLRKIKVIKGYKKVKYTLIEYSKNYFNIIYFIYTFLVKYNSDNFKDVCICLFEYCLDIFVHWICFVYLSICEPVPEPGKQVLDCGFQTTVGNHVEDDSDKI